jgi:prefoldin subunit 5
MIKHTPETLHMVTEALYQYGQYVDEHRRALRLGGIVPEERAAETALDDYRRRVEKLREAYQAELERAEKRAAKGGEA